MKKPAIRSTILAICIFAVAAIGCGKGSGSGSHSLLNGTITQTTAAVTAQDADAILRYHLSDHQQRTEALFLYRQVLDLTDPQNPADRPLRAKANLGIGLINFYDLFDVLPALLNMLGINLTGLLSFSSPLHNASVPLANPKGIASATRSIQLNSLASALSCTPVNFGAYLPTLDRIITNMITPATEHFKQALADDPNVTLLIEDGAGIITLSPDNPGTPEDDSMVLDLSGKWDAGSIGVFAGIMELLHAVLNILTSYDGLLQNFVNPAFSPDCSPPPGSADWVALFGPYGTLNADGGSTRMLESQQAMSSAFSLMAYAFAFTAAKTGDLSKDVISYGDVGRDGKGPGDPSYTAPDADGSEGDGKYEPDEPWGLRAGDQLIGGLLGSSASDLLKTLSKGVSLPLLSAFMYDMSTSVDNGTTVDMVRTLIKPIVQAMGGGGAISDKTLYSFGLPALNLGAPFHPVWSSIAFINPLMDAAGNTITDPESSDVSHTWPDGSGRIDPPNGTVDPGYAFYPDLDQNGNFVGAMGGLLLTPVVTADDFDASGNLIGVVDYFPMTNGEFNRTMTTLGGLLGGLL